MGVSTMSVTVLLPNLDIHHWLSDRDNSTGMSCWLVTRKEECERKDEVNKWLPRQEETSKEVSDRITVTISDTKEIVPVTCQVQMEDPISREFQFRMWDPQTEEEGEKTMEDKDGILEHALDSWLVKECHQTNDCWILQVTEVKDIAHSSFENEKEQRHENGQEDNNVAKADMADNLWLTKNTDERNIDNSLFCIKDDWLAGDALDKDNDGSVLEDKDQWLNTEQDNKDMNPTGTNCWLAENTENVESFTNEYNNEVIVPEKSDGVPTHGKEEDDTASIVTLDPTEEFDDFSDMQLELSQWISNV